VKARALALAGVYAAAALLSLAACGKKAEEPKVDAAAERAAATERAKKGPFGAQVQSLETAKGLEADLNKKAQDQIEKNEK
jgi:hypothetical protein